MLHVAVLLKPYLDLILSGKKTVECRLTVQARDPYDVIQPGERIYFKQSSGPYGATAIAEHVIFEDGLTPKRVKEIQRDYNSLICGEQQFWTYKKDSNYCTLIWLKDVQAIDLGPEIRPLQGVAWLVLEDEPAWRRTSAAKTDNELYDAHTNPAPQAAFFVEVTSGNLRNNCLYVTGVMNWFPKWALGGKSRAEAARPMTLILHEGPTVQTDIVEPRHMLRTRIWGKWFRTHGVKAGDRVVFTPFGENTYFVGLSRAAAGSA